MTRDTIYIEREPGCPYFYTAEEDDPPVDVVEYVRADLVEELILKIARLDREVEQLTAENMVLSDHADEAEQLRDEIKLMAHEYEILCDERDDCLIENWRLRKRVKGA